MARKIIIGVVAVIVVFLLIVVTRPATFHVERSTTVSAPPETVFGEVNDFHAWSAWSPWDHLDPQMARTFEGPASGPGAVYMWKGNDKVGEGKMTIEKADRPSLVGIKLEFIKPFAATNQTAFAFAPAPEGTRVTWAMDGENSFMGKAMSVFMSMDKMIGGDFERGLAAMKADAEAKAKAKGS